MSSIVSQISAETAELIAAGARARGLSINEYLKSLLPHPNGGDDDKPLYETATTEEWVRALNHWAADHPIVPEANDTRESIYPGRGE
jgi:hypothetical protein